MNPDLLHTFVHFGHPSRPETLHHRSVRHNPPSPSEALLRSLAKAQEKARVQARLREVLALLKFEEHRGPSRTEPQMHSKPTEAYTKTHLPTDIKELVDSFTRTVGRLPQAEQDRAQALISENFGLKPANIEMELADVKQKVAVLERKVGDDYWPMELLKSEVRGMRCDVAIQNKELDRLKAKLANAEAQMMEAKKENQRLRMENEQLKRTTAPATPNYDPSSFDMDTCDWENMDIEELLKSLGVAMEYMTMSDYGSLYQ